MRVIVILLLVTSVIGCVTTDPATLRVPTAVIHGVVVMKEEVRNDSEWAYYDDQYIEYMRMTYGSIGGLITYYIMSPEKKANPYLYYVATGGEQDYRLIHDYSGFSVGDCVKILKYNNEVTMTYGDDCSGIGTANKSLQPTANVPAELNR